MTLASDITRSAVDFGKVNSIVHGTASQDVVTDGGTVPTFAKMLANLGLGVVKGAWVTATAYALGDVVTSGGAAYRCVLAHTSGATFAGDLATKWVSAAAVSIAMQPVITANTLAAGRSAMGPWGDAVVTPVRGSQSMTLDKIADREVDLRAYGAVGDGVANDTTAFQDAIDDLTTGGTIFVKNGTYSLDTLSITKSGITIRCESPSGTILVPELGSAGEFLFNVDLSASVRPFYFRFTNGQIAGNTTTRPMHAFKLKHVYCGGVDNSLIKGVNKALYFSDSYWSNYENLWIEHYTLGISAESTTYPGNQNNFKNVNLFDGSEDDVAVPFNLTAMGNCLFDTCTIGSSAGNKVDQLYCWNDNTFINCRFESIRTNANQVVNVGHRNRFMGCYFTHQDGFGSATTPSKNYIKVSGDNNLFDSLPLSFYGNLITLDYGTKGNEVFFDCDGLTTNPGFADFGDNKLHFDRRDHSSNSETSSEFAVTNLWTRSTDGATATADGVTAAAHTDVGPFDFGEVIRLHTPTGNRRWYFSLGSVAAGEVYAFAVWMKAVSGTETVEIQLDPQETPRQVTVRSDRWIRVYHATSMQGGPFTRRAQITLGVASGGILVTAPQVVYLGTAGSTWPKIYWGGYVPVGSASRKVAKPNHTATRFSYAIPTYGTYNYGDTIWSLQAASGGAPGWVYTSGGWKAMANLA